TSMLGMMEAVAVADTEAVVHGQDHIAVTGEILVHRVGVAVIIHIVPSEQHLPRRAAMDEDQRRHLRAAAVLKELALDGPAVSRLEGDGAWRDELPLRTFAWNGARAEIVPARAVDATGGYRRRRRHPSADERNLGRARRNRRPFERGPARKLGRHRGIHRDAEEMA